MPYLTSYTCAMSCPVLKEAWAWDFRGLGIYPMSDLPHMCYVVSGTDVGFCMGVQALGIALVITFFRPLLLLGGYIFIPLIFSFLALAGTCFFFFPLFVFLYAFPTRCPLRVCGAGMLLLRCCPVCCYAFPTGCPVLTAGMLLAGTMLAATNILRCMLAHAHLPTIISGGLWRATRDTSLWGLVASCLFRYVDSTELPRDVLFCCAANAQTHKCRSQRESFRKNTGACVSFCGAARLTSQIEIAVRILLHAHAMLCFHVVSRRAVSCAGVKSDQFQPSNPPHCPTSIQLADFQPDCTARLQSRGSRPARADSIPFDARTPGSRSGSLLCTRS